MSKDTESHDEEVLAEPRAEPLLAASLRLKAKRNWVEWGKTAGNTSDDFMPGRIDDIPMERALYKR